MQGFSGLGIIVSGFGSGGLRVQGLGFCTSNARRKRSVLWANIGFSCGNLDFGTTVYDTTVFFILFELLS